MKPSITSLNLVPRNILEAVELGNICAKKINVHYHPHSRNCVTLNTSNASVCENNDAQQYNQTYSAAAYSSRPRFLTPIPKATQTISDSVHRNLSSASVSVPLIFYTNTRSLVNKMDETELSCHKLTLRFLLLVKHGFTLNCLILM